MGARCVSSLTTTASAPQRAATSCISVSGAWEVTPSHHADQAATTQAKRPRRMQAPATEEKVKPVSSMQVSPKPKRRFRALYLFSGAPRKSDVRSCVQKLCTAKGIGLEMVEVGLILGDGHDLYDGEKWEEISKRVKGKARPFRRHHYVTTMFHVVPGSMV